MTDMKELSPTQGWAGISDVTTGRADREIRPIGLDKIDIPSHTVRALDNTIVDELYQSIRRNGLLQPIGVRRNPDQPGRFDLIWGRHRLEAFKKGYQLHYPDEGSWVSIPAVFYTDKLTVIDAEILTIIENLQRHELNAAQKDGQRVRLAALLKEKQFSKDKTLSERQSHAAKAPRNQDASQGKSLPPASGSATELPTTAKAVAAMTNVTARQVNASTSNVLNKARKEDPTFDPDRKLNIATASPDQLRRAADMAEIRAKREVELREANKPPRAERPSKNDVVPPAIFSLIERAYGMGGEAVFKLAVNKLWKQKHPQGRVIFNVDWGDAPE